MQKQKTWYQTYKIPLLSFSLPVLIMLFLFIVNSIYPFGDRSFLHIDMYHQYMPFLSEMYHKIKGGDSLFYSWNTGIGSNFLALFVYYLASPTNWLSLLMPESLLIEFMSYMTILKIGLCGLTFSWYLKKHFRTESIAVVFFAVFYALSGYMAAYNWNVMWLDCIILAPLIILGLEQLVMEGKYRLYCITLSLAILSNYYICIMICIYLVLYFFVLLLSAPKKGRALMQFAVFSLLAGGMAAILLLPEAAALHYTEFSNTKFPSKMTSYFPLVDVLARHSVNVPVETGLDHWPNIYCGAAVFFLLPLYVIRKEIPLKEKLPKLLLLFFLLISFSTNTLNFIWHGLNYPDSLPARQSFLYILLLLTVCFEAVKDIREYKKSSLGLCFFGLFCFLMLCDKLIDTEMFTFSVFLVTAGFLFIYALLAFWYHAQPKYRTLIVCLTLCTVVAESTVNTYTTSVSTVSRTNYLADYDSYQTLISRLKESDPGFYRVEKFKRLTQNDAMLIGYPSATVFSSTSNAHVKNFYEKYGMKYSKVFYCYDGATPVSSALLSVKYMISKGEREPESLYRLADQEGNLYLYENNYALPFSYYIPMEGAVQENSGYSISDLFGDVEEMTRVMKSGEDEDTLNAIEVQNRLAGLLSVNTPLFEPVGSSSGQQEGQAVITAQRDGYLYALVNTGGVKEIDAEYEGGRSKEFTKLKKAYVLDLGYQTAGSAVTLETEDADSLSVSAYMLNETAMQEFVDVLSREHMELESWDSTHIRGRVNVAESGELVLSVPYEPGWTLKVDGEKASIHIFEDTLMSVALEPGEHTIELSYYPSGFNAGILISVLSLLTFLAVIWFLEHPKKR